MYITKLLKNNNLRYAVYILLAQAIFMLSNLYINHLVEQRWSADGFAIYNLIKRIGSFVVFPLVVGIGIGIPRFISFIKSEQRNSSLEYLLAGLFIFLTSFCIFSILVIAFPQMVLGAFNNIAVSRITVLRAILLFILGQGIYVTLNAYFRGRFQIGLMSLTNILIMSVIPLGLLFSASDVFAYVTNYSLIVVVITVVLISGLLFRSILQKSVIRLKTIRLFRYGYPRMIGDIGLFALEFLPVFMISTFINLEQSGYIAISLLLLKLGAAIYEVAGSLILPYYGKLFRALTNEAFIRRVNLLLIVGFAFSLLISVIFYFGVPLIISDFFPSLALATKHTQLIFLAFPFYAVYLLLRNILDVIEEKAYNSINLGITFVVQLAILSAGIYLHNSMLYSVYALAVPYVLLGTLSYFVWSNLKKGLGKKR